jgi:hypothetical protein
MKELIEACRELAKHLETQRDPAPDSSTEKLQERLSRTQAERYRQMAGDLDARDAAIERFRKALDTVEAKQD